MKKAFLLCAVFVAACGGGGGDIVNDVLSDPIAQQPDPQQVVVSYDINNDEDPDTLTIDADGTIVEALETTAGGATVDTTDIRKGEAIDPRIAEAIAAHLAASIDLASETRLDVVDSSGRTVNVRIFE